MFACMNDIQLRLSKHRVELIADAIEQHIDSGETGGRDAELTELLTYLRYRLARTGRITGESISG